MSDKHTPGPWVFDPDNNGNENGYGNGVHAATSGWTLAHIPHRNPEWAANARLIAAAPDLLMACQEALLGCTDEFLVPVLQAAIAKAGA